VREWLGGWAGGVAEKGARGLQLSLRNWASKEGNGQAMSVQPWCRASCSGWRLRTGLASHSALP